MKFTPELLAEVLLSWPAPKCYVVLASGGGDSTVLLHAMAALRERLPVSVVALHFDHGLNEDSALWRAVVARQARTLGIECFVESLHLDARGGAVETHARKARYARLRAWMQNDDCCLTAHHADDQAETFLLQALRGAGPAGLAAMPAQIRLGPGWLARPLLDFTRAELSAWAEAQGLEWVEDPGNLDQASPRNRLRRRVWPEIVAGWPAAARTLGRSAELAAEAAALIEEVAAEALERIGGNAADRLSVPALLELSVPRRRAVLRYWLNREGVETPTAEKLRELERDYVLRDPGARARLPLAAVEIRRFHDALFVVRPLAEPPVEAIALSAGHYVEMGALGRIGFIADPAGPLAETVARGKLELCFRRGGETLRPAGGAHHRPLKKLLQEEGILPWMRDRLPLLYVDGELAAVAGVAVAEEFAGKGWRLDWQNAPVLQ